MNIAYYTMSHLALASWIRSRTQHHLIRLLEVLSHFRLKLRFTPLQPLRQWLNNIEIQDPRSAQLICRLIPAQCPFARQVQFRGRVLFEIPPMCKLNPLYDELMYLRFQAMCYLEES